MPIYRDRLSLPNQAKTLQSPFNPSSTTGDVRGPVEPIQGTIEPFTGSNGSGPPSGWIANTFGGTQNIQGNQWHMVSAGGYIGTTMTFGTTAFGDVDLQVRLTLNGTRQEQYPALGYRLSGGSDGWGNPYGEGYNGYNVYINVLSDTLTWATQTAAVAGTSIVVPIPATAGGNVYQLRVLCIGSTHKIALWRDGSSQKGWQIETTEATWATGVFGCRDQTNVFTCTSDWDDFTYNTFTISGAVATLGQPTVDFTASNLGTSAKVLDQPTVAFTGTQLSTRREIQQPAVAFVANPLATSGRQLGQPTVDFTASNLRNSPKELGQPTVAFTASQLHHEAQLQQPTAAFTANDLRHLLTIDTPIVAFTAYNLTVGSLAPPPPMGSGSVSFVANAFGHEAVLGFPVADEPLLDESGDPVLDEDGNIIYTESTGSLAMIANRLFTSGRQLGTAAVAFTAFDLAVFTPMTLGSGTTAFTASMLQTRRVTDQAAATFAANNLNGRVTESATGAAAFTANNMTVRAVRVIGSPSVNFGAFDMTVGPGPPPPSGDGRPDWTTMLPLKQL